MKKRDGKCEKNKFCERESFFLFKIVFNYYFFFNI